MLAILKIAFDVFKNMSADNMAWQRDDEWVPDFVGLALT
jgi:hypothetical protein